MRAESPRILDRCAALMIEELHTKAGVDRSLVRVRDRPPHLVQTESCEQMRFLREAMIDSNGKLISAGCDFRRRRVSARSVWPVWIVGQRIGSQHGLNCRINGNHQSVARECRRIDALPLQCSWNWKDLRCTQDLPETLVLSKIKCPAATVIYVGNYEGPAISETELVPHKGRNPSSIQPDMLEVVSRIKSRIP